MKVKSKINGFFFWLVSLTWGAPLTIIGAIVALVLIIIGNKPKRFGSFIYFEVGYGWGGLELGAFFIVSKSAGYSTQSHEAGHGIQNLIFGFMMPFIVCIPSAIRYWWRKFKIRAGHGKTLPPYDSIWFEGWATKLGEKYFYNLGGDE